MADLTMTLTVTLILFDVAEFSFSEDQISKKKNKIYNCVGCTLYVILNRFVKYLLQFMFLILKKKTKQLRGILINHTLNTTLHQSLQTVRSLQTQTLRFQ